MDFMIRALEPGMAQVFTDFFERIRFEHSPSWASCFCRFYHMDCPFEEWKNRTGEDNKSAATLAIQSGEMKGYLAYDGETCIGWVNANVASAYPRLQEELKSYDKEKWGLTICYVIDPAYRGQGVMTALLEASIKGFREASYHGMLAAPVMNTDAPEKHYRGKASTYRKYGYKTVEEVDGVEVMELRF